MINIVSCRPSDNHNRKLRHLGSHHHNHHHAQNKRIDIDEPAAVPVREIQVTKNDSYNVDTLSYDYNEPEDEKVRKCYENEDLMELCQRCAKETKSNIVFPLCCANEDSVTGWCKEYIFYGRE